MQQDRGTSNPTSKSIQSNEDSESTLDQSASIQQQNPSNPTKGGESTLDHTRPECELQRGSVAATLIPRTFRNNAVPDDKWRPLPATQNTRDLALASVPTHSPCTETHKRNAGKELYDCTSQIDQNTR